MGQRSSKHTPAPAVRDKTPLHEVGSRGFSRGEFILVNNKGKEELNSIHRRVLLSRNGYLYEQKNIPGEILVPVPDGDDEDFVDGEPTPDYDTFQRISRPSLTDPDDIRHGHSMGNGLNEIREEDNQINRRISRESRRHSMYELLDNDADYESSNDYVGGVYCGPKSQNTNNNNGRHNVAMRSDSLGCNSTTATYISEDSAIASMRHYVADNESSTAPSSSATSENGEQSSSQRYSHTDSDTSRFSQFLPESTSSSLRGAAKSGKTGNSNNKANANSLNVAIGKSEQCANSHVHSPCLQSDLESSLCSVTTLSSDTGQISRTSTLRPRGNPEDNDSSSSETIANGMQTNPDDSFGSSCSDISSISCSKRAMKQQNYPRVDVKVGNVMSNYTTVLTFGNVEDSDTNTLDNPKAHRQASTKYKWRESDAITDNVITVPSEPRALSPSSYPWRDSEMHLDYNNVHTEPMKSTIVLDPRPTIVHTKANKNKPYRNSGSQVQRYVDEQDALKLWSDVPAPPSDIDDKSKLTTVIALKSPSTVVDSSKNIDLQRTGVSANRLSYKGYSPANVKTNNSTEPSSKTIATKNIPPKELSSDPKDDKSTSVKLVSSVPDRQQVPQDSKSEATNVEDKLVTNKSESPTRKQPVINGYIDSNELAKIANRISQRHRNSNRTSDNADKENTETDGTVRKVSNDVPIISVPKVVEAKKYIPLGDRKESVPASGYQLDYKAYNKAIRRTNSKKISLDTGIPEVIEDGPAVNATHAVNATPVVNATPAAAVDNPPVKANPIVKVAPVVPVVPIVETKQVVDRPPVVNTTPVNVRKVNTTPLPSNNVRFVNKNSTVANVRRTLSNNSDGPPNTGSKSVNKTVVNKTSDNKPAIITNVLSKNDDNVRPIEIVAKTPNKTPSSSSYENVELYPETATVTTPKIHELQSVLMRQANPYISQVAPSRIPPSGPGPRVLNRTSSDATVLRKSEVTPHKPLTKSNTVASDGKPKPKPLPPTPLDDLPPPPDWMIDDKPTQTVAQIHPKPIQTAAQIHHNPTQTVAQTKPTNVTPPLSHISSQKHPQTNDNVDVSEDAPAKLKISDIKSMFERVPDKTDNNKGDIPRKGSQKGGVVASQVAKYRKQLSSEDSSHSVGSDSR